MRTGFAVVVFALGISASAHAQTAGPAAAASEASPVPPGSGPAQKIFSAALDRFTREHEAGRVAVERLTVIDYSLPSTERRLWVVDPKTQTVLFHELVAHGRGSGELIPDKFGNTSESHLSSLGAFLTGETYSGAHGYSLRLDGLDPGVNDNARAREIVIHGAAYVTEQFGLLYGRIGRSFGCPALDTKVSKQVINEIRGGSLVMAFGPDRSP